MSSWTLRFSRSLLITYLLTLESWKKVLFLKEVSSILDPKICMKPDLTGTSRVDWIWICLLFADFRSLIWLVQSVIPKHTVKEIDWRKRAISTLHWWLSENAWNIWDTTKKIRKLIYLMLLLLILFALKLRTLYLPGDTENFTEKWLFHPIRTHVIHEPCIWPSLPRVLRGSVVRASCVRKVIDSIPYGDSDFSLSQAMLLTCWLHNFSTGWFFHTAVFIWVGKR